MKLTDIASPEELAAAGLLPGSTTVAAAVASTLPSEPVSVNVKVQELFNAARTDLNILAACCIPHVFKFQYPPVFLAAWAWVLSYIHTERTFPKLALGLPRGFGKTLVIKLLILYTIIYTHRQYILVFNASEDLATNTIGDVANAMDGDTFKAVFGDWTLAKTKDTQTRKIFYFRGRAITLQAAGAGTQIRGTNVNDVRPDFIVFDDIQSRDSADSKIESDKLKTWFQGTAMKLRSPSGCLYVFLANMYPTEHSMLKWLNTQKSWLKFITGAILENGQSLWPELYPIEQLLAEYASDKEAGRADIFMAELMNDGNATVNDKLDVEKIRPREPVAGMPHAGSYIIIDPARGVVGLDAVAIGYFEIQDDRPIMMDLAAGAFSPGECIRQALTMAFNHNCPLICVEAVAYQETLLYWFGVITEQLNVTELHFEPIYPSKGSKNQRILNMFKEWAADEVATSPKVHSQVWNEALQFNPSKTNNTDNILDLMTYATKVRAQCADFLAANSIQQLQLTSVIPQIPQELLVSF